MRDAGYDVTDYRDVDPCFGTLDDADRLLDTAHGLGLKVLVDLVPNHTSTRAPVVPGGAGGRPGQPGTRPLHLPRRHADPAARSRRTTGRPSSAARGWTRVTEPDGTAGQWFLHIFDGSAARPQLAPPRGARGVPRHPPLLVRPRGRRLPRRRRARLVKRAASPTGTAPWGSTTRSTRRVLSGSAGTSRTCAADGDVLPTARPARPHVGPGRRARDLPGVAQGARLLRRPDRILCAEAWVKPSNGSPGTSAADEMHQAFNFDFLDAHWDAAAAADGHRGDPAVQRRGGCADDVGAVEPRRGAPRLAPRPRPVAGRGRTASAPTTPSRMPCSACAGREPRPPSCSRCPVVRTSTRARSWGLPEHTTMPDEYRQDPTFHRTDGQVTGRDGCRVPMPWEKDAPSLGFGPGRPPWLPQPEAYADLAVDQQDGVGGSTLELYRALLDHRRTHRIGRGSLTWDALSSDTVIALRSTPGEVRAHPSRGHELRCRPGRLPGGEVVISSGPLSDDGPSRRTPRRGCGSRRPDVRASRLPLPRRADPTRPGAPGRCRLRAEPGAGEHPRGLPSGHRHGLPLCRDRRPRHLRRPARRVPRQRARPGVGHPRGDLGADLRRRP